MGQASAKSLSTRVGCFGAGCEIRLREAPARERRRLGRNLIRRGGQAMGCFCEPRRWSKQTGGNFFPASRRNNPKTVWRFVSVGPWGRRPRRIGSAQGAAPILRESLQEASISKRRRQIMTLTPAPIALSRRLEEAQSRRFKGGMMSFSLGCCPSWRRDADK